MNAPSNKFFPFDGEDNEYLVCDKTGGILAAVEFHGSYWRVSYYEAGMCFTPSEVFNILGTF